MTNSIFLSHSHKDKTFVRKLGYFLEKNNLKAWIDEGEIFVGDSLTKKIESSINSMDFLGVILSENSIRSDWVLYEVRMAIALEKIKDNFKVIPIILDNCTIPEFLSDKYCLDFRKEDSFEIEANKLINSIKRNIPLNDFSLLSNISIFPDIHKSWFGYQRLQNHSFTYNLFCDGKKIGYCNEKKSLDVPVHRGLRVLYILVAYYDYTGQDAIIGGDYIYCEKISNKISINIEKITINLDFILRRMSVNGILKSWKTLIRD